MPLTATLETAQATHSQHQLSQPSFIYTAQCQLSPVFPLPSHGVSSLFCSGLSLHFTWRDLSKPELGFQRRPLQCQAEPKHYCMFPTGTRKPGLGADMAVPLPVPELSHSFGYLWLLPCCKAGKSPSVLLNFSFWSEWVWELSYSNLMTSILNRT